ncbi:MAG: 50S ribosomal protein L17 [Firmicutes bacterium]|nr:50S ribosomal protein L17 [Bacillota bacterium]
MAQRKLGRTSSHREAMLKNALVSLFKHERIKTTEARAKEISSLAEKLISLGKRGDLHARRQAAVYIRDKEILKKLFDEIAPAYEERAGGYTRLFKLGPRRGDAAPQAILELVK